MLSRGINIQQTPAAVKRGIGKKLWSASAAASVAGWALERNQFSLETARTRWAAQAGPRGLAGEFGLQPLATRCAAGVGSHAVGLGREHWACLAACCWASLAWAGLFPACPVARALQPAGQRPIFAYNLAVVVQERQERWRVLCSGGSWRLAGAGRQHSGRRAWAQRVDTRAQASACSTHQRWAQRRCTGLPSEGMRWRWQRCSIRWVLG